MKEILYGDCNHNGLFLKQLFEKIQRLSNGDIHWKVSELNFNPVYKGDWDNGIPSREMEIIYNFRERALQNYTFRIYNSFLMKLLDNIETIYDGLFIGEIQGEQVKIKIFDGDIIELQANEIGEN